MPEFSTIGVFLVASLVLLVIPGPSVLYVVARGVDQGRAAGLVSALGISMGALGHAVAASLGISALLVSSATAFTTLKYVGAAYLVFLGIRTLIAKDMPVEIGIYRSIQLRRIFLRGAVVEILNPKVALFFFAFLPQFVDPTRGSVVMQTLLFGGLFAALGAMTDSIYAIMSGVLGARLNETVRFRRKQRYISGGVYLALGAVTAFTGPKKQ